MATAKKGTKKKRSRIRTMRKDGPPKAKKKGGTKKKKGGRTKKKGGRTPQAKRKKKSNRRHVNTKRRQDTKSRIGNLPSPKNNLRIIPLGGVEEIGKNMTVIEYKDDIVIIDAGFQFSEEETPGIDYLIPDVTYLEAHKEKIRGLFITHGHYDHIGAIPYIMERIGNPPVYTREFGAAVIKKRQTEFPHTPTLDLNTVDINKKVKAGKHINVRFFEVEHAIRDSMGIIIETPVGNIVLITDVRVDHKDGIPTKEEKERYAFFEDEDVLLFMLDSTNVEKPGFSTPESEAIEGVAKFMKEAPSRVIIGAFSSQVERVMQFIKIADKLNKKVVIDGRSMKNNVAILKELGLIDAKNIIPIKEIEEHPPEKIVVIATGAQGEEYSVFDRIANKTHKYITLSEGDTVIFSSSVVPGNEMAVQKLKDNLYRQGPRVITYRDSTVHASGHGSRGELEWIHKQINYKFFMPMHGHHYMLHIHKELSQSLGTPLKNIVIPDNGSIVEISPNAEKITKRKEKVPTDAIMVDGFSVGNTQEVVLRDRQVLAEDGIVVVVVSLDPRTGTIRKSPDIIARGFVYVRESQQLLDETRAIIKRTIEKETKGNQSVNFDQLKKALTDAVRKHLYQRTAKSPMVIPVIIGV